MLITTQAIERNTSSGYGYQLAGERPFTYTRTREIRECDIYYWKRRINTAYIIDLLINFNESKFDIPKEEEYSTFYIPKRKGGWREIKAPSQLMTDFQKHFVGIMTHMLPYGVANYHTAAYAYVKGRNACDAVKKHAANGSRYFLKLDMKDFFGSITQDWAANMLKMQYPYGCIMSSSLGENAMYEALDIAFLNGGLPQGTVISPMLTNICMIPIDKELQNSLYEIDRQHFVYTRYADDIIISSKHQFSKEKIVSYVVSILEKYKAPFRLNDEKTAYVSSKGGVWLLGIMYTDDGNISIGCKNKKRFKSMLTNYCTAKLRKEAVPIGVVYELGGYIAHYKSIERENIGGIVRYIGDKFNIDIMDEIKRDLKSKRYC